MKIHLAMLISDWLIYGLLLVATISVFYLRRVPHIRNAWQQIMSSRMGMMALVVLCFYMGVALLDSVHLQIQFPESTGRVTQTKSLLDIIFDSATVESEKTYSAPFALQLYNKSLVTLPNGQEMRGYARLKHGGSHLVSVQYRRNDIIKRVLIGLAEGLILIVMLFSLFIYLGYQKSAYHFKQYFSLLMKGKTKIAWREMGVVFALIVLLLFVLANLASAYHILGTDKVGNDVFYETVKSVRTGLFIGTLTTIFMLPLALLFGTLAGYFGGWVDDVIQYLYTTLSSIPGVLLISAAVLVLQIYITNHSHLFPTLEERADARLLALCFILGITSWANLCRLLRSETFKLRELEYVQAARALGVAKWRIILRHILPNVMHIILITIVLDFSGLVLAEAVLSYVGVGVDPTTMSWGNMINSSRLELAREPLVWWPLIAALILMFILVLAANLFSDAVRDALDPRLRNALND